MKTGILIAMLLNCAACASLLHSNAPPSQVYLLRATIAAPGESPTKPATASLQVARPFAGPGLDSDHIAIVQPEHRMSYYAGSQWAAALPVLLETLVVERLRGTGVWGAVNDSESGFASDYYLQIGIRRFEAEYTAAAIPTVRVRLDCAIGRRTSRELLASFSVDGEAAASANRVSAVVAAFEQATNAALGQLAERSALAVKSSQTPSTP
jgi:cholesterol transport system auxiliary component